MHSIVSQRFKRIHIVGLSLYKVQKPASINIFRSQDCDSRVVVAEKGVRGTSELLILSILIWKLVKMWKFIKLHTCNKCTSLYIFYFNKKFFFSQETQWMSSMSQALK